MAPRRWRYVIVYDITDNKGRTKVARALEGHGQRVQYSVFECPLDKEQFEALWDELSELIERKEDSLRAYRLCAGCAEWTKMVGQTEEVEDVPQVYIV
jgi:CRISPR-associated protein Cas2